MISWFAYCFDDFLSVIFLDFNFWTGLIPMEFLRMSTSMCPTSQKGSKMFHHQKRFS